MTRVSPRRATHFLGVKSKQKRPARSFGPATRGSRTSYLFRGHAAKGHPWPIAALAASMPQGSLHKHSVCPTEGLGCGTKYDGFNRCELALGESVIGVEVNQRSLNENKTITQRSGQTSPSGGREELLCRGVSRMDAARGIRG